MEKDINPFPEVQIVSFDRLKKIARFVFGTPEVPMHMSNHYERSHFEPTDGEAVQPQLPFEVA